MKSFDRYRNRINILGTTMSERALNEGKLNYEYYLNNAGNQLRLPITDVGEPYITEKTKIIACTMRDVKFNDQKNFDQKVITVPADTNMGVGSYVMWDARTYLVIYEQHKEIPTHKTYVIRLCNSYFHCYDKQGNVIRIPMSSHDLTLYSNGLRDGKFLDYENSKRKVLISNNPLTSANIKVGQRVFFSKFNTFRITSIDDYSMEGLFAMMFEQTLNEPEDNDLDEITINQEKEYQNSQEKPAIAPKENNVITGSNIKVGMTEKYELVNTIYKEIAWSINVPKKVAILAQEGSGCSITANSSGALIGTLIKLEAKYEDKVIASKEIEIESLF